MDRYDNFAFAGAVEFAEVDGLPAAEEELVVFERDGDARVDERSMRHGFYAACFTRSNIFPSLTPRSALLHVGLDLFHRLRRFSEKFNPAVGCRDSRLAFVEHYAFPSERRHRAGFSDGRESQIEENSIGVDGDRAVDNYSQQARFVRICNHQKPATYCSLNID